MGRELDYDDILLWSERLHDEQYLENIVDKKYFEVEAIARTQSLADWGEFTLHMIPFGAAADHGTQGEYGQMSVALLGDAASLFSFGGAALLNSACKGGRFATVLKTVGTTAGRLAKPTELLAGVGNVAMGSYSAYNAEYMAAGGSYAEGFLRLVGVPTATAKKLVKNACFVGDTQVVMASPPIATASTSTQVHASPYLYAGAASLLVGAFQARQALKQKVSAKKMRPHDVADLFFGETDDNDPFDFDDGFVPDRLAQTHDRDDRQSVERFYGEDDEVESCSLAGLLDEPATATRLTTLPTTKRRSQTPLMKYHNARTSREGVAVKKPIPDRIAAKPQRAWRDASIAPHRAETEPSPTKRTRWAVGFLLAAAMFFSLAFYSPESPSATRPSPADFATKRIEEVRPGERTLGINPLGSEDFEVVDPATWRMVVLAVANPDGTRVDVELLRPLDWIDQTGAVPGAIIDLQVSEDNLSGEAQVVSVEPCPPIQPGVGNLVTGRFRHEAKDVVDLHLDCDQAPIGCTSNHPFWSEDRHTFVPASDLSPGEHVLTRRHGIARVTHVTPRSTPLPVFNLEIQGEHVYEVGESGILVHNTCLLQPYGGKGGGGGHHIFAKRAFEDVPGYDKNAALAIPDTELTRLNLRHLEADGLTTKQRELFTELAESGRPNTLQEHARIARESLVYVGMSRADAKAVVNEALKQLKRWGIKEPARIPWN